MTRPQTVQDVLETLSQNRLVEPARLEAFLDRHKPANVATALERLVSDGLLTAFQASEVAHGHADRLWLGSYRLLDRLGRGGMGSVFLAEHAVLGRRVALKALSDGLRADPGARKRFVREARAAAALDHPNIVHVFDVNMNNDPPYLVMEFVDGISLQAAVSTAGTFSAGEAASVGVQVADGLVQAAAVGLVHRDIKPANLLVDRRGAVKILDLGIVRFTHDDTHSRVNGTEVILGTLDYLAPEQAEDSSKVDIRADIYALGATLYFLLAGHPPYPVADLRRKLNAKQTEDPPPIHHLRPDVPAEFSAVLARLMARDPAARYLTPALVVAALYPWATSGPDFPARLFRITSDTTAHGRRLTDHEPREVLPETVLIVKTSNRRSGADSTSPASQTAASPASIPKPVPRHTDEPLQTSPQSPATQPAVEELSAPTLDTQGVGSGAALTDEVLALPREAAEPDLAWLTAPAPEPAATVSEPKRRKGWIAVLTLAVLGLAAALIAIIAR